MFRKITKYICIATAFFISAHSQAIYVGSLTFSMTPDSRMVTKYVINNNKATRLYRITAVPIDTPGQYENKTQAVDGELLFSPRQITLRPGEGDFFKFFYNGPKDSKERYYRVAFEEIPLLNQTSMNNANGKASIIPVIVIDTILVVRPRNTHFKWMYNRQAGIFKNSGNTWFKLLIKPDCEATEDESDAWYMRPGDTLQHKTLENSANIFIVYNDRFIKVTDECK